MTGHTHGTQTHDSINTLLQNGFFEGIPLIAEMPANAAFSATSRIVLGETSTTAASFTSKTETSLCLADEAWVEMCFESGLHRMVTTWENVLFRAGFSTKPGDGSGRSW